MSLDRSLKTGGKLARHRNVLTRAERIDVLVETERWAEGRSVYNLPKVAHRKAAAGKKPAKAEAAAEGAAPAAGAAAAAAPAAGGKAAAPAAKAAPAGADKKPAAKK